MGSRAQRVGLSTLYLLVIVNFNKHLKEQLGYKVCGPYVSPYSIVVNGM